MPEGLQTLDGKKVDIPNPEEVEQKFAQAMSQPPPGEDIPAPPKKPDKPPAEKRTRRTTAKPRVTKSAPPPSKELDQQRANGVAETMNLLGAGCLMLKTSVQAKDPQLAMALTADAYVLSSSAEAFGQSCAALAKASPGFAKLIDGSGKAGPWFAFSTTVYSIGGQLAANHGLIPAGLLGTAKPEDIVSMIEMSQDGPDVH